MTALLAAVCLSCMVPVFPAAAVERNDTAGTPDTSVHRNDDTDTGQHAPSASTDENGADDATVDGDGIAADESNADTPPADDISETSVTYRYYDTENGEWKTGQPDAYTSVTSSTGTWSNGWYVAEGNVTVTRRVTVKGNVHLILKDGTTLNANKGITVKSGKSLTIYAQSESPDNQGALNATGSNQESGIGGRNGKGAGAVTIHGGKVTAKGGTTDNYAQNEDGGAGIGGGYRGAGGTVTIHGGTVKAIGGGTGTHCASGIGGGVGKTGGTVIVNGGNVTAYGEASGIGGGYARTTNGTVTINGGTVTANGYEGGISGATVTVNSGTVDVRGTKAAIKGGAVMITGGTVTATGEDYTYEGGIGVGGTTVTIKGGTVKATGGNSTFRTGGAGINGGTVAIAGGDVTAAGGKGNRGGAGIGGGFDKAGGTVIINGGTVAATGGVGEYGAGAGIGGASGRPGGTVTINGGVVITKGGDGKYGSGAGIGGGGGYPNGGSPGGGAGGTVTITGGTVTATGGTVTGTEGKHASGIGAGSDNSSHGSFAVKDAVVDASSIGDKSEKAEWNGIVFEGSDGQIYLSGDGTSFTLQQDLSIPAGKTLTVPEGMTLVIPDGVKLTISENAKLVVSKSAALENNGTITGNGTLDGAGELTGNAPSGSITMGDGLRKATAITVSVTPSRSVTAGSEITITATVTQAAQESQTSTFMMTRAGAMPVTSGTVDFYRVSAVDGQSSDSGTKLNKEPAVVDKNGKAELKVTVDGTWSESTIKAVYTADDSGNLPWLKSSTGETTLTVDLVKTETMVTVSANSVTIGSAATLTATVAAQADSAVPVSDGTVEFLLDAGEGEGGVSLGSTTVSSNGKATLDVVVSDEHWKLGERTITAKYSGTTTYAASEGTASLTVESTPSNTTIAIDPPGSVTFGASIKAITATVTTDKGTSVTDGKVTFLLDVKDGKPSVQLGEVEVKNGAAVLENIEISGDNWKPGKHAITAKYSGSEQSPWYGPSEGSAEITVIAPAPSPSPSPSPYMGLTVSSKPNKVEYRIGEAFDGTGMVVKYRNHVLGPDQYTVALDTSVPGKVKAFITLDSDPSQMMSFEVTVVVSDVQVHRLYNRWSGEHFYTAGETEYRALVRAGWRDEGVAFTMADYGTPVYRLYLKGGKHLFTTSRRERDALKAAGWRYEGVAFHVRDDGTAKSPVHRLYSPWSGDHLLTTSTSERGVLMLFGWRYEGVAFQAK
ncbi:Ig-like domain repeat protein [Bifidobacterium sp. UTBIF-78]|uniref:Ig-like domain repeat protein n=1 Tax=Bifidobacterium sp. UTBIF-78 TaxID=1465263 RepID=UPI0015E31C3E|nr:Ig-like domain repeat protein [Bifidobacterium sp. UTBIF-78]TPF95982.1 hypothetical protein BG22_00475 [Bifidobacterium sp. UTBIF-78]